MTITELADMMNRQIIITYYPLQGMRFSACLKNAEIKKNGFLSSAYGDGESPTEAINNYIEQIRGKTIVFGAYTDKRQEYVVPETLELWEDKP